MNHHSMMNRADDRLAARAASVAWSYVAPWAACGMLFVCGSLLVWALRGPGWIVGACALGGVAMTWLAWAQSGARHDPWRLHATASTGAGAFWLTATMGVGVGDTWRPFMLGWVIVGASWNIRRWVTNPKQGDVVRADRLALDPAAALFARAADVLDPVEVTTTNATPHKIEGVARVLPGKTGADFENDIPTYESYAGLPPGSLTSKPSPDNRRDALWQLSDPRVLKKPLPWPGPSAPGLSIALAAKVGMFQTMDPMELVIIGQHLLISGMSGSGKSFGGCWGLISEWITRHDVALFAGDMAKGEQTLGVLADALHRVEYTAATITAMLDDLHGQVFKRTTWLARRGLQKWREGCGLSYWIIWLEEYPKIQAAMTIEQYERFEEMCKELRSGGGSIIISGQLPHHSQIPTVLKEQMARMTFGMQSEKGARLALSDRQLSAGCAPEEWKISQPGSALLDAHGVPDHLAVVGGRTWYWGDDEAAYTKMRAHVSLFPASARPGDEFTQTVTARASGVSPDDEPIEGKTVNDEPDTTADDDSPAAKRKLRAGWMTEHKITASMDDGDVDERQPIAHSRSWNFGPPETDKMPMDPADARALILHQIERWACDGVATFTTAQMGPTRERTGLSRPWSINLFHSLVADGYLERTDHPKGWRINAAKFQGDRQAAGV